MRKFTIPMGGGWLGLLGVILVVLKVLNYIRLDWLWVLMPFWFPIAALVIVSIFVFIMAILAEIFK